MTRAEADAFFRSLPDNAVYALCDQSLLDDFGLQLRDYAELCETLDVSMIQYRNKSAPDAVVRSQLRRLRDAWEGMLIVNDRWHLADVCDGVHLGQEDLYAIDASAQNAVALLKARIGNDAVIGLSTHNAREIAVADDLPIDYIGLGAFRRTGTKGGARVLGAALDTLAERSRHPVAAIGGVTFADRFEHARMRVMGRAIFEKAS